MKTVGIWLIVFGALSFLLPHVGYDLKWFEMLGQARIPAANGLLVVGAVLVVVGWRRKRASRHQ